MAQTIAYVVETHSDGRATVVAEKVQGCGSCSAVSQCHGGRTGGSEPTPALNRAGAAVGDRVMLTVESGVILSRMALLYLLPVAGLLVGAFTGSLVSDSADAANGGQAVGLGLAGFVLGFAIAIGLSRIWSAIRPVIPVITRTINPSRTVAGPSRMATGCGCSGK
jgi:sigma-E factor negative regulatory protein RseC